MRRGSYVLLFGLGILSLACGAQAAPMPPTSGQVLWLAADTNIATGAGNVVTGWSDANTGLPRESGYVGSPTLTTSVFPNGAHDVVSFDGASGINLNDPTDLSQQNLSVYVVGELAADQASRIFIADYHNNGVSNGWASGISDSNTDQVKWFSGPDNGDAIGGTTGLSMSPGTPYLITTTIDSGGKFASIFDGTTTLTASDSKNSIPYDGSEQAALGYLSFFNVQYLKGNIAEVLVYSGINSAERAQVTSYLDAKYFAPVPEPSSVVLLSLGAAGLFAAARRRRS